MQGTILLGLLAQASALRVGLGARPAVAPRCGSPARMAEDNFDFGESGTISPVATPKEREMTEKEIEIARLRAAEKFMKKETGDAVCSTCGYTYEMAKGASMTAPPNTPFSLLGDSWTCPKCKSPKAFFTPVTVEIAGFEDNQSYGLGTNSWTEAQKGNAIFGGLGFCFVLLMSGYALN